MSTGLILYESAVSSYVQKVKIALREKDIPFTVQTPPDLASNATSGPLRTANPRVEVPVLLDGDLKVFDSTIILEYLEDKFPSHPLLPGDAAGKARARMIEELCDTEYEGCNWGIAEIKWFNRGSFDPELQKAMLEKGAHHIKQFHAWLSERLGDGPFFHGEQFGWADASAAPIVNRSKTLGYPPAAGSALEKWLERIKQRDSVRLTFEEYEKGLGNMKLLAKAFETGERRREYRSQRLEWIVKAGGLGIVEDGISKNTVRFTWPDNP